MLLRTLPFWTVMLSVAVPGIGLSQDRPAPACDEVEGFHTLDFWVGEWEVFSDDQLAGTNRIEKILNGCAIMEHWTGAGGGEGKSLFYYHPTTDTWKQVWITQQATRTGAVKEKELVAGFQDGVRFRGRIPLPDGGFYHDRTTLTPLEDGSVRQVIEVSRDGENWRVTFDARYLRK